MPEKNLDFDTVIDRKNTNCLKYDFAMKRGKPENILPLWVADMDFRISSYIQEALAHQVEHGILDIVIPRKAILMPSAVGWRDIITGKWKQSGWSKHRELFLHLLWQSRRLPRKAMES